MELDYLVWKGLTMSEIMLAWCVSIKSFKADMWSLERRADIVGAREKGARGPGLVWMSPPSAKIETRRGRRIDVNRKRWGIRKKVNGSLLRSLERREQMEKEWAGRPELVWMSPQSAKIERRGRWINVIPEQRGIMKKYEWTQSAVRLRTYAQDWSLAGRLSSSH